MLYSYLLRTRLPSPVLSVPAPAVRDPAVSFPPRSTSQSMPRTSPSPSFSYSGPEKYSQFSIKAMQHSLSLLFLLWA